MALEMNRMGQILIYVGAALLIAGVLLLLTDAVTYKRRQKRMLDKIEEDFK